MQRSHNPHTPTASRPVVVPQAACWFHMLGLGKPICSSGSCKSGHVQDSTTEAASDVDAVHSWTSSRDPQLLDMSTAYPPTVPARLRLVAAEWGNAVWQSIKLQ